MTPSADPQPARRARSSRRFWLLFALIVVTGAAIRVGYTTAVDPEAPRISDAAAYHLLGENLSEGRGYVRPFDLSEFGQLHPTAEYPPAFPVLVAGAHRLGVESVDGQELLVGTLVGTTTVALVGLLGRRVGGDPTGLVAGGIAAVYPMLFQADAILMSEGLFALLVTAAMLLATRTQTEPAPSSLRQVGTWVALGAVLGLAALTRGEALLLAPILVVPLAWRLRLSATRRVAITTLTLAVAAMVVLPWTIRNAVRLDAVVPVSTNIGTVVDGANCDLVYSGTQIGLWRSTFPAPAGAECFEGFPTEAGAHGGVAEEAFDEAATARDHLSDGARYALDHAPRWVLVVPARMLRTFAAFGGLTSQIDVETLEGRDETWQWIGTISYWLLVPLAIGGGLRLRRDSLLWPLLAPIVTVAVVAALTYGNQRFRIAAEPAIVVLAATGLVGALGALRDGRTRERAGRSATPVGAPDATRCMRSASPHGIL